jgi:hypothetical protein
MTHPDLHPFVAAMEDGILGVVEEYGGIPIFTFFGRGDLPTSGLTGDLHSVTDSQYRNLKIKNGCIEGGRIVIVNPARPAAEDHSMNSEIL